MLHLTMSNSTGLHKALPVPSRFPFPPLTKPGHHPRLVLAGPPGVWVNARLKTPAGLGPLVLPGQENLFSR